MVIKAVGLTVGQGRHELEVKFPNNEYDKTIIESVLQQASRHYSISFVWEVFDDDGIKQDEGVRIATPNIAPWNWQL